MSIAVLISIQPKWCELIAGGKKTVEVRKSRPKIETPFKCYFYCTKDKWQHLVQMPDKSYRIYNGKEYGKYDKSLIFSGEANCKVIGEFLCNKIDRITHCGTCNNDIRLNIVDINLYLKELDYEYLNKCKLSYYDLEKYSNGCDIYGWNISDLVIYDKPKELSEFYNYDTTYNNAFGWAFSEEEKRTYLKRPPQSWCYVEELSV